MASIHSDPIAETAPIIDGIVPPEVASPESPQEIADLLASAAAEGKTVAPIGGGTSLSLGNVPERIDIGLTTTKLTGIISYEPTDLTLSVWAGSRFADVNAQLADQGQTLPLDVPYRENATIGGLIASGLVGPRRSGSPTFRDLLIGISAAHPSGTVTKAGGMVVKNVTGFDLMRLYLGSLGTLGVVVSANFKVLPLARFETTLLTKFSDLASAIDAGSRVREGRARPIALEVFRSGEAWAVAVRLEGRESTVRLLLNEVRESLTGDQETFEGEASKQWWQSFAELEAASTNGADVVLRCSVRPRLGDELLQRVNNEVEDAELSVTHLSWSPALGTVTARISAHQHGNPKQALRDLREQLLGVSDNTTVLAAPAEWKTGLDVWGRPPETIDIMRALKEQFDPARVLNPGRFAGGI
jgi:glycolate oxidase FAD binding subunit